jgi:hypothetical protein
MVRENFVCVPWTFILKYSRLLDHILHVHAGHFLKHFCLYATKRMTNKLRCTGRCATWDKFASKQQLCVCVCVCVRAPIYIILSTFGGKERYTQGLGGET